MAYITLDQAKQLLGDVYESAYINVTTQVVDDTILQDDIDGVTSLIDSYVKKLYNQTLAGAQTLILMRTLSEQILYAKAYERYDSSEVPDFVRDRYDRAIFRLKDIANGDQLLSDEVQSPRGSAFVYNFNSGNTNGTGRKVFDRDSMGGY